ncbi:Predicted ATPase [Seinonella peptonophila]|uniref:Predicted ATPase n=1 Tax=Seinonella peptonophila TaxID=112248 RepID=A0A1M4YAI4_9BACL|nr:AAA family ATPase [Seinonella peptonophila]SHF02735.1 Predicted ATPase [Seinonella peptonophila]
MILQEISCSIKETKKNQWLFQIPAVNQLIKEGLRFQKPITFFVGENGSGKSTIVEAVAESYGLDAHGGRGGRKYVNDRPKTPLGACLKLKGIHLSHYLKHRKGYFLRAETAFGYMSFVSGMPGYWKENIQEMSHGEGFLTVLETMFHEPGLYLLDEPEAALSFQSCLRLITLFQQIIKSGGQVICATHSPLLTAFPNADIFELNDGGVNKVTWQDLALVDHWRRFLDNPSTYFTHLLSTAEEDGHD